MRVSCTLVLVLRCMRVGFTFYLCWFYECINTADMIKLNHFISFLPNIYRQSHGHNNKIVEIVVK